jgi:hypothetical protein
MWCCNVVAKCSNWGIRQVKPKKEMSYTKEIQADSPRDLVRYLNLDNEKYVAGIPPRTTHPWLRKGFFTISTE